MPIADYTAFDRVNTIIADDIKQELRLQGHYLTGELERSIDEHLSKTGGALVLTAEALGYLETLEKGTSAGQINISNAEFAGLVKWVILRGLAPQSGATAVAAAIVAKWKKVGRPSSVEYSSTGKSTEAVHDTFEDNSTRYNSLVTDAAYEGLDNEFIQTKSGII